MQRGVWQIARESRRAPCRFRASRPRVAMVNHYDTYLKLGLTNGQKRDLIEFLKSL